MLLPPKRRTLAVTIALALLAACGEGGARARPSAASDSALSMRDDGGRMVALAHPARRVVSLVPSATETLIALGAAPLLAGRNDYDTEPQVRGVPSVGGGLDPSVEKIVSLRPDLVIGWETSGRAELHDRLAALGIPMFSVKTEDTTDVFRSVRNLGRLIGRTRAADSLASTLRAQVDGVRASVRGRPAPTVFFVGWYDPPMTAGPKTFVSQVIGVAGGRNAFDDQRALWPNVSIEEVVRRQPDFIVVPEGEEGAAKLESLKTSPGWRELRALREGRAVLIPAELINRPGPRLGEAAKAMRDALHPELRGR